MYRSDNPAQNPPNTKGSSYTALSLYTDLLVDIANKLLMEEDRRIILTLLKVVKAATESIIYLLDRGGK